MIRLPNPVEKRKAESTISLINVVFLMLIFFLIAGQLSPPVDPEVELVRTEQAPPLPPPDALFVSAEGELRYRGNAITPEAYMVLRRQEAEREADNTPAEPADPAPATVTPEEGGETVSGPAPRDGPPVMLAADRNLAADRLLEVVDGLYRLGAAKVSLVTTGQEENVEPGAETTENAATEDDADGVAVPSGAAAPATAGAEQ
ncbi:MAG: hypothetical protein CMN87_13030 [Stappia sp.]|uniref:ExbD/TolR family protein n=1 Tax=Stappia sp. TaxID=1870903 RepID=UPI000C4A7AB0|nr:biopolymer transporter ExbD [Stappia sp.]MAA99947.1 hypothetical protein [Stappia sp.]MBM20925.1 hypothetical protein [Stappia sp.]